MYIWWLLTFCAAFFCGKLTNPGRHARTFQLVREQSLASINNKHSIFFNKIAVCSHNFPHHWGIGIRSIPCDLRSKPEQLHHLPGALLSRWLQEVYRVFNGRHRLQLYRKGAYLHYLWLYSENTAKQVCYLTKANFHQKTKMMNLQYFSIFMYISWLLIFFGCFFGESLPILSSCKYFPNGQPAKLGK